VDFDIAAEVFDDPNLFVVIDARTYGERRYRAIGASRGVILFVAHTMRGDNVGGLSAPGGRAVVKEQLIR
jgi:uncharacterized DUF497 family protein